MIPLWQSCFFFFVLVAFTYFLGSIKSNSNLEISLSSTFVGFGGCQRSNSTRVRTKTPISKASSGVCPIKEDFVCSMNVIWLWFNPEAWLQAGATPTANYPEARFKQEKDIYKLLVVAGLACWLLAVHPCIPFSCLKLFSTLCIWVVYFQPGLFFHAMGKWRLFCWYPPHINMLSYFCVNNFSRSDDSQTENWRQHGLCLAESLRKVCRQVVMMDSSLLAIFTLEYQSELMEKGSKVKTHPLIWTTEMKLLFLKTP